MLSYQKRIKNFSKVLFLRLIQVLKQYRTTLLSRLDEILFIFYIYTMLLSTLVSYFDNKPHIVSVEEFVQACMEQLYGR